MCSAKALATLGVALMAQCAFADVKVAKIFGDNMVLQRDTPLTVWGTADAGEKVNVSFAGQSSDATADAKGNWSVELKPLAVNKEAAEMAITGNNAITLKNILVGDVWLCSGQSNMEMSFSWGIMGGDQTKKESDNLPMIRQTKFQHVIADFPQTAIPTNSQWDVCSSKTLDGVTATGYYFALTIHKELGIPVGLLNDNWSGCKIEPFCSAEGIAGVPELKSLSQRLAQFDIKTPAGKQAVMDKFQSTEKWIADSKKALENGEAPGPAPEITFLKSGDQTCQYNAMIAPIVKFPIKGALWYQGCSNAGDGDAYYYKTKALVEGWRKAWGYDFPFYFVQLAAFNNKSTDPAGGNGYARIREVQARCLDIPKTGMAVTIDIGNETDIHPKDKMDVGRRLALWALANDYGKKDLVISGPLYKDMKIEGGKVRIEFNYAESGLMVATKKGLEEPVADPNGKLAHFAIAGADKKWFWANAVIDGKSVVVSSPEVKEPVAVRYAYRAYPDGVNFYNKAGLPAVPFRTDKW